MPEFPRGEGHCQTEVPAGSRDDAGLIDLRCEHAVERAARFERAGVLEELELQLELPRDPAQGERPEVQDRRATHPAEHALSSRLDVEARDGSGLDARS